MAGDEIIDELLTGSVDLHVHVGPDPAYRRWGTRRFTLVEAGELARKYGQPAVACKSHLQSTASVANLAQRELTGVTLLGAIALNRTVGGLNPYAVRVAGQLGARILWFPTLQAAHHLRVADAEHRMQAAGEEGVYALDEKGALKPEVEQIVDLVKEFDMLLCTAHVSFPEALAIVQAARKRGVERIVITHPFSSNSFTLEEGKQLADLGAAIEFTFIGMMPFGRQEKVDDAIAKMRAIGPQRCIITTDFGSYPTPPPPEGMRMFIGSLLMHGMEPEEVEWMCKRNPQRLVGIG
ncbi:MAG: hypothetical protein HYY05_05055 [Chloroflexi bacterium]|nr:hypothetical protein [Chloroflexota bacterium]